MREVALRNELVIAGLRQAHKVQAYRAVHHPLLANLSIRGQDVKEASASRNDDDGVSSAKQVSVL